MDAIDVAVLRWMMTGLGRYPARSEIRESMSSAAKKLHLTETTLRSRTRRLFESGFLEGWLVFVNPRSVNQRVAVIRLDVLPPSAKEDVIRKIRLIDDVWLISKNHESALGISTYYSDEASLKKKVELMARIANSEHVTFGEIPFPQCSYTFRDADLAIIRCVQESPSLTYSGIAKLVHLSGKTVRRRLNRMIREMALFVTLDFDFSKSKGIFIANLLVTFQSHEAWRDTEQETFSLIAEKMFGNVRGNPALSNYSLILDNVADMERILSQVKRLEGVNDAYLDLCQEYIALSQPMRDQVERLRKVPESSVAQLSPPPLMN